MHRRVPSSATPAPLTPEQVRYVHRVLRRQTHAAAPGTLCRCGACRAVLIELAAALGTTSDRLRELVGAPGAAARPAPGASGRPVSDVSARPAPDVSGLPAPEAPGHPTRTPRPRRPLHSQVGVSAAIRVDGQTLDPAQGLLHLAVIRR